MFFSFCNLCTKTDTKGVTVLLQALFVVIPMTETQHVNLLTTEQICDFKFYML